VPARAAAPLTSIRTLKPQRANMGLGSWASSCSNEASSLLTWSMLAACTVGPGTVITCARAGAEDDLVLIWCLVAASIVAYILQEESGRLTMVSGSSFGHALRVKFAPGNCPHSVPVVRYRSLMPRATVYSVTHERSDCRTDSSDYRATLRWCQVGYVVVVLVFFGNAAYEANCFAGAMGALYILYEEVWWFRILGSLGTGVLTLIALFLGDVDTLGKALGTCVVAMAVLFGICAATVPIDPRELGTGLVVPRIPAGSSITVLSLVSTTAVPFNVFLAASMCSKTASLGSMQRGIGFAAFMTAMISILIVVVGSAITVPPDRGTSARAWQSDCSR
jgi:manganese transport protein